MASVCFSLEEVVFPLVIVSICAVLVLIVWITFLCKYNESNNTSNPSSGDNSSNKTTTANKDSSQIKLLGVASLTVYFISVICFVLSFLTNKNCVVSSDILTFGFLCHFGGFTLVLITFTVRIIKTFKNTNYAIPNKHIKFIYHILIPLLALLITINALLRIFNIVSVYVSAIVSLVYVIIFVIYAVWLLRLFIKRLNIIIYDFIKQFGKVSNIDLAKLNKSVSYVYIFHI